MKFLVFVVDDDRQYAHLLKFRLERDHDCEVRLFYSGEAVLEHIEEEPDLILLDVMMPGIGGIEALRRIKAECPDLPVVMVSAQGIISVAIEAMKQGAYDYITKGQDDLVKLNTVLKNVMERIAMSRELENLRSEVAQRYGMSELIGDSSRMEEVYRMIQKALRGDLTVAIMGESGTGKELVARAIHFNSPRRHGPFVVVNCAAIPRELMESEFFGHERGSFTGAHSRKIGKFEQSNNGTLFLDEIGELDLGLQAKLLRALQNREIQRVGGNETISFDSRVISATNRDILSMIRTGTFREDLYYRLFEFPIPLPPLRERGQDALLLANHFLKDFIRQHPEFSGKKLSVEARKNILEYSWPGNVRELKSAIERAILLSDGETLQPDDLMLDRQGVIAPWTQRTPQLGTQRVAQPVGAAVEFSHSPPASDRPLALAEDDGDDPVFSGQVIPLEDLKRRAVEHAYHEFAGNVDKAAVELGIGRATMYRLLKKYDLMK